MDNAMEPLAFYQNVSTNKEIRDASNAAEAKVREYSVEAAMRLDVYQAKLNAQKNIDERQFTDEQRRLMEKMVGLKLDLLGHYRSSSSDVIRFSTGRVLAWAFQKRRGRS